MAEKDKKDDKIKKETAAPEAAENEGGNGAESADSGEASSSKKRKLVLIVILALTLLIAISIGIYFGAIKPKDIPTEPQNEQGSVTPHGEVTGQGGGPSGPIYFELKEFLVNLNSAGKQTSFLKMIVTLELPNPAAKIAVEANMPRIVDAFQIYLRELRTEDLRGSAGIQLLREELLLRINKIIAPEKASDILFKEIIVQ